MKLLLLLCLLLTHHHVTHARTIDYFLYEYHGEIATGIPASGSSFSVQAIHSGVQLKINGEKATLQLKNTGTVRGFNDNFNTDEFLDTGDLVFDSESDDFEELKNSLELPISFIWTNGSIADLFVCEEDEPWSINIKKAVLSMLNWGTNQPNTVNEQQDSSYRELKESVEGTCERLFTTTKVGDTLHIHSTTNFESCRNRFDIRYNFRFGAQCMESTEHHMNAAERNTDSQSITTQTVRARNGKLELERAQTRSQYILAPMAKKYKVLGTFVKMDLALVKRKTFEEMPVLTNTGPKLVERRLSYDYDHEMLTEEWLRTGDNHLHAKIQHMHGDVVGASIELINDIHQLSPNELNSANHKMTHLVDLLRLCTTEQLRRIEAELINPDFQPFKERMRNILLESLSIARSKVALDYLLECHRKGVVSAERTALYIRGFIDTQTPSDEMISELLRFAEETPVQESETLRQSVFLIIGTLMNGLCGKHEDRPVSFHHGIASCDSQLRQRYHNILTSIYDSATNLDDKVLALKTVANSGLTEFIPYLSAIISGTEHHMVRLQAMDAFRQMTDGHKLSNREPRRVIQEVLVTMFLNCSEPSTLRMNALHHLLHTQLVTSSMLEQIVQQMRQEQNEAVQAFTYSTLLGYTKTRNPCEQKLGDRIKQAMRSVEDREMRVLKAKFAHSPHYLGHMHVGATFDLLSLAKQNGLIPSELLLSLDTIYGGQWNKHYLQVGFSQVGLESRMLHILERYYDINRFPRRDQNVSANAHAYVHIRYKNLDLGFISFDGKNLDEESVVRTLKNPTRLLQSLENTGIRISSLFLAFFYECSRTIATSIGMPLRISGKLPSTFSLDTVTRLRRQYDTLELESTMDNSGIVTHVVEMNVGTPQGPVGTSIFHSLQMRIPMSLRVKVPDTFGNAVIEPLFLPEVKFAMRSKASNFIGTTKHEGLSQARYRDFEPRIVGRFASHRKNIGFFFLGQEFCLKYRTCLLNTPYWMEALIYGWNTFELTRHGSSNNEVQIRGDWSIENEGFEHFPYLEKELRKHAMRLYGSNQCDVLALITQAKEVSRNGLSTLRVHFDEIDSEYSRTFDLRIGCQKDFQFCFVSNSNSLSTLAEYRMIDSLDSVGYVLFPKTVLNPTEYLGRTVCERSMFVGFEVATGSQYEKALTFTASAHPNFHTLRELMNNNGTSEDTGVDTYQLLKRATVLDKADIFVTFHNFTGLPYYSTFILERYLPQMNMQGMELLRKRVSEGNRAHLQINWASGSVPSTNLWIRNISADILVPIGKFSNLALIPKISLARRTPLIWNSKTPTLNLFLTQECRIEGNKVTGFESSASLAEASGNDTMLIFYDPLTRLRIWRSSNNTVSKILIEDRKRNVQLVYENLAMTCFNRGELVSPNAALEKHGVHCSGRMAVIDIDHVVIKFNGRILILRTHLLASTRNLGLC